MGVKRRRHDYIASDGNSAVGLALAFILSAVTLLAPNAARAESPRTTLAEILQSLSSQGAQLIYSSETVPRDLKAIPPPPNLPLEEQLEQLLKPTGLEARRLPNGAFVIARAAPAKGQLTVTVLLQRDGALEPLSGALIVIGDSNRRGVSDAAGRVRFDDLSLGRHEVAAGYNGLTTIVRSVQLSPATPNVQVALHFALASLDEILVQGSVEIPSPSPATVITRDVLENTPTSSNDASKVLQLLPGAASAGYSAKTHIRGSRDDETLFRYDGITLFDPYHYEALQSLTSGIDPSVIESTTVWPGVAPIQVSLAAGAVVDFAPRTVTAPVVDVRLSNRDLNAVAGLPLDSDQVTVLAGVHEQNNSSPARWLHSDTLAPSHRDYLLRATWRAGTSTRLAAGILAIDDDRQLISNDQAPTEVASPANHERYLWLRAWQTISLNLQSETLLSLERSHGQIDGRVDAPSIELGTLSSNDRHSAFAVREELIFRPDDTWSALAGAERTNALVDEVLRANATFQEPFVPGLQALPQIDINSAAELRAVALSFYGSARWQRGEDTVLDLGVRHNHRQFVPQPSADQHWNASASLKQKIFGSTLIHLGLSQTTQESVLEAQGYPDNGIRPSAAREVRQVNLGAEHPFGKGLLLKADLYDKHERTPYANGEDVLSMFTLLPDIALDNQAIYSTGGRMRGMELQFETDRLRPVSGWLSYTRSIAEDRMAGQWVRRSWDQPNAVQIGSRWNPYPWQITGLFSWHTGWPTTPLLVSGPVPQYPNAASVTLGPRNSERLPNYASLDLRVSWEHPLSVGIFQVALELNDVTNAKSICCRYLSVQPMGGASELNVSSDYWAGFAPQLTFRWHL